MKKQLIKTIKLVVNLLLGIFVVLAIITALTAYSLPIPWKLFVVQSGSMSPAIQAGAIVLTAPQGTYQKNDIITYKIGTAVDMKAPNATLTHRIIETQEADDGSKVFITKGDDNPNPDSAPVTEIQVIGKVLLSIPLLGHVLNFAKTQVGLVLLIVIPATLIVYSEVLNLKREVATLIDKRKQKKSKKSAKKKKND